MPTVFPVSTGQAARILNVTEPRLAETVRRGKVAPEPVILAGRRLWSALQMAQAAKALGVAESQRSTLETLLAEYPEALAMLTEEAAASAAGGLQ